jgi:hypothetical protein
MSESLSASFTALERLKCRKAKINNDAGAIEAGRKKGSIKKSRPQFTLLIAAIDAASEGVRRLQPEASERLKRANDTNKTLQRSWTQHLLVSFRCCKKCLNQGRNWLNCEAQTCPRSGSLASALVPDKMMHAGAMTRIRCGDATPPTPNVNLRLTKSEARCERIQPP